MNEIRMALTAALHSPSHGHPHPSRSLFQFTNLSRMKGEVSPELVERYRRSNPRILLPDSESGALYCRDHFATTDRLQHGRTGMSLPVTITWNHSWLHPRFLMADSIGSTHRFEAMACMNEFTASRWAAAWTRAISNVQPQLHSCSYGWTRPRRRSFLVDYGVTTVL